MSDYPNLKGVVTKDVVEQVRAGSYSADYVNWSRTMQLLRDHAPGWLPELVTNEEGGYVHAAGVGGFLLIRFRHKDGETTPAFPQAIMDNRNAAIPLEKITARDITDTHRRGLCMAAALAFGLAYELWAKMPLESGYQPAAPGLAATPTQSGASPEGNDGVSGAAGASSATPPADAAPQDQLLAFNDLLVKVADSDPKQQPATWWVDVANRAAQREFKKPTTHLTSDELASLTRDFQTVYGNFKSSGGDSPSSSPSPPEHLSVGESPSGTGSSAQEAADAPAESPFKAPTGPRGSGRKAA